MKFIDLFSGVGGFTRGLELAGHECIGHCELDKFAEASYRSMHTITEEQRKYLLSLPLKQRQKEILKEEYLNGEWYESDITKAKNIPKADIWTFGAPCQDFSIAGRRAGLNGGRSSLVREVFRLLGERQKEDRPEWIIYENVRGMLSSNRGCDYLEILASLDELGYDVEWQNINSKWFVPQNRERVYTIGHLRGRGGHKILPIEGARGENHLKQLVQGSKIELYAFLTPRVLGGIGEKNSNNGTQYFYQNRIYDTKIATAVSSSFQPYYLDNASRVRKLTPKERFRLQGWADEYFEKAKQFNSDSQLYKQAGNGVTVDVVKAIGEKLREQENESTKMEL